MLNKLLQRQVQKHFGNPDDIPEELKSLLKVISEAYDHYEKDRNMLERSIELSSMEMVMLNEQLRKETAEVKLSHYNLKTLFENIQEVFFSVEVNFENGKAHSRTLQISPGCIKLYGYPAEDFFRNPDIWRDLVIEEDKVIISQQMPMLLKGEPIAQEYRIRHKDGSVRWIGTKITPTLNESGKLIRIDSVSSDICEKKSAEAELEKTKQKLEEANKELNTLFNNIDEVMYSVDMVSYKLIQMSTGCKKVYGYTPEQFLANDNLWKEVIHPDDLHIPEEQVNILYKGQQVFNQYRIIHKDGSIRWIENIVIPTLDENKRLIRLDGLTKDITTQRNNAQKLQESEVRFRSLIENSVDMLTMMDERGKVLYQSPAVAKTLGYASGENTGIPGLDLFHPGDSEKLKDAFEFIVKNPGESVSCAARLKTKDKSDIYVEGDVTNLLHVQGINAVVSNFRDVTKRVEAERHLDESRKRYRLVYENPFLGIALGTIEGKVQNVNQAFCNMLGYTERELRGMHFTDFTFPEDVRKELVFIDKMKTGEIDNYQLEKRYITKTGKLIRVELSISCANNESGEIQFLVAMVRDITAEKKAEELLYQSEINMASILENTDDHVYSLDKNCCYITFNSRLRNTMKELYNLDIKSGDKAYGFLEQIDPAEAKFWKKIYSEAIGSGKPLQFVKDYSTASMRSYASFSINPIMENNMVTGLSCFVRDITQQKLSEELLHKSEANLRNLLENTDTAYVLLDTESNILSYNRLAKELAANEMRETLEEGKNYLEIMLPHRKEDVKRIIKGVLKKKESARYEVKYGEEEDATWLLVSMHPIMDNSNKLLGLSIAAINITARKNAEQQLKQSNERYELARKATNDAIWDWDLVNGKLYWSEAYEKMFGYEHPGDRPLDIHNRNTKIHPEDKERVFDSISRTLYETRDNYWESEYKYIKSNAEIAHISDRGYIIYDENKKPVRMVGAMRDITTEKLFAIERDKITSDIIRQNKDLEQFAYIVSHNLRAPLANIVGLLGIIRNKKLDAQTRRISMDGLTSSVQKLDDVIIDLGRILNVKREINEKKETVRFSDLVEDIKLSVHSTLEQEEVIIHTDFSEADEIFSLKSYLHSIFYNLISNSIKYRKPAEKPVIRISSAETENKIILRFNDNGRGIDLGMYSDKVFGLYKRFHYNVEGKGMGLFMVKTQVETLGGKISIKSGVNLGTEFIIEFEKPAIPASPSRSLESNNRFSHNQSE